MERKYIILSLTRHSAATVLMISSEDLLTLGEAHEQSAVLAKNNIEGEYVIALLKTSYKANEITIDVKPFTPDP
jgi:hypothetical protein